MNKSVTLARMKTNIIIIRMWRSGSTLMMAEDDSCLDQVKASLASELT